MRKLFLIALLVTVICPPGSMYAQAPSTMVYQGRLLNAAGVPITTAAGVTFRIYSEASGGSPLWTETVVVTPDDLGMFTVELGLAAPLTTTIFNGSKRYLGLDVGADGEAVPRQLLASVPYAERAGMAGNLFARFAETTSTNLLSTWSQHDNCQVALTVPGPGYITVDLTARMQLNHVSGTADVVLIGPSTSQTGAPSSYHTFVYEIPSIVPTAASVDVAGTVHASFSVSTAGTYTYYLVGTMSSGADAADFLRYSNMSAMFIPGSPAAALGAQEESEGSADGDSGLQGSDLP